MVLELQGEDAGAGRRAPREKPRARRRADQDVVSALVNLGYKASQAERAVAEARREKPDAAFNELLRASLNRLSRAVARRPHGRRLPYGQKPAASRARRR